ncbi:hypothetical protein [Mastigocoleus testarum]|uniref:hypothetical protein n=1 Tax=Mastigocoleus testarum TaxID=996925 RepID=UPI001F4851CA|nr:hypothetical protein [Mastigocoleus testarum]
MEIFYCVTSFVGSQESEVEYSLHLLSRVLDVPQLLIIRDMSAYMRFSIDLRNLSKIK